MKKHLIAISLLSAGFILSSCGEKPVETLSSSVTESSSNVKESSNDASSVTSSESSSSTDSSTKLATSWSDEDLSDMSKYLEEGFVLPFATGLTTNYLNASGTDSDGECFIVYDYDCGDLSDSYAKILKDAGYIWELTDEDDGLTYTNYYYPLTDELASIYVQYYYDDSDSSFNIFAWYEERGKTTTFPYSIIQEYFELETTLSATNLPSFALATGESYDAYSGDTYFYVGGYFDSTISDADFVSAYETSLNNAGYTVNSTNASATNESVGLDVGYMASEGYFLIQLSAIAEKPAAGNNKVTIESNYFSTGYVAADSTVTIDSIKFGFTNVCDGGGYVQFKRIKNEDVGGEIYNITDMGQLNSIVVTVAESAGQYYSPLTLCLSTSQIDSSNQGVKASYSFNSSTSTYVYNIPSGYGYFKLFDESESYASKNASIVINYTIA